MCEHNIILVLSYVKVRPNMESSPPLIIPKELTRGFEIQEGSSVVELVGKEI